MGIKISIFLILFGLLIKSQGLKIEYSLIYQPKLKDTTKKREDFVLNVNTISNQSIFESQGFLKDKVVYNNDEALPISIFKEFNFKESIYKNGADSLYIKLIKFEKHKIGIRFDFPVKQWVIDNLQKKIFNYNCHQAKIKYGGRNWIAWFTKEIPIADGPFVFYGLPGLILELNSEDDEYHFYVTAVTKENNSNKPPDYILKNQKDYDDLVKRKIKDPAEQLRKLYKNSDYSASATYDGKDIKVDSNYFNQVNNNYWEWMKNHDNPIEKGTVWIK